MKKLLVFCWLLMLLPFAALPQDEVLMLINNEPVLRSEFERIYHKNSNIQGIDTRTPREYLELFINFRLKVLEAEKLGYDTVSSYRSELAGYRDQLAKPYLQDRELIDSMVREAYYRTANEVNASHIMVKLSANAAPEDTLKAYTRIMAIRKRLLAGESFEKIAREESEDPSARINEGRLGWFSAFTMVLPFENAAYSQKEGEFSLPVKSRFGYHIIRLNGKRPSQGEIKLSHIMIRAERNGSQALLDKARARIDSCYHLLQQGSTFTDMVKKYSEDAGSAQNGGQLRWLRPGELPPDIEEVVFALTDSAGFTVPVQSDYGWHIFRMDGKRPVAPFNQLKAQLEERIMADDRGRQAEEAFLQRLMKEYGFVKYPGNISALAALMDSSVYDGKWNSGIAGDLIEPVFAIAGKEYSQKELADFISQTSRYRREDPLSSIVDKKCTELIKRELMAYEKDHLEEKYADFRLLMKEYHDGILLFNIMDDMVWNKAIADSAGLHDYFVSHANDYMWQERADVSVYSLTDAQYLNKARKLAAKRSKMKWSAGEITRMVCPDDTLACIAVSDYKLEKDDQIPEGPVEWKKGYLNSFQRDNTFKVVAVNAIIPPEPKEFKEIRGQVTADYQNFLDKQWIDLLRAKYPVVVYDNVIQQIQ